MNGERWTVEELKEYYRTGKVPSKLSAEEEEKRREATRQNYARQMEMLGYDPSGNPLPERPAASPTCCQAARPSGVSVADMEADAMIRERGGKVLSREKNQYGGTDEVIAWGGKPKRRKYGNEPQYIGWKKFDSKKEAEFYRQLMLRVKAGELWFVIRQVPFDLAEKERLQYFADFVAVKPDGTLEAVYDVKSEATRKSEKYVIKKKLMKELWDIEITEV